MGRLTVETPAGWLDCLACAGGRAYTRKAVLWQRSCGQSCAIFDDGDLLAVVFLVPEEEGRMEFCLLPLPAARPHMLSLCRLAHSTLTAAAKNGAVVICHVREGNRAGARMARLTGFRHVAGTLWRFGEAAWVVSQK